MLYSVITTIQHPTDSVRKLAARLVDERSRLVIAGDTKGPDCFDLSDVPGFNADQLVFLSLDEQLAGGFRLAELLPTKHYARKNIGYLQAMRAGATCIYETDDDNAPLNSWRVRSEYVAEPEILCSTGDRRPAWVNVYRHFSGENIWPRGLPLDQIHTDLTLSRGNDLTEPFETPACLPNHTQPGRPAWAPIQQGLADGSPDVDAIWRLVLDREFTFHESDSVMLPPYQWCPFNTQSTWWWPVVYPLMYVPSYCSFRMCDIWKSFVAQRCLWELGTGVVFHAPEVWQERNMHNLLRDFNDEIPGYQLNHRIAEILDAVSLTTGPDNVGANLKACYGSLVENEIFPGKELPLVDAWLADVAAAQQGSAATCK